MAGIDDIIKRYKEHLTKAQIQELIKASERYKQINAGNRAEAYDSLYAQHSQTRRSLQNMGLAGRQGKIISGQEKAAQIRSHRAYEDYDRALRRSEEAYTERAAIRMANETVRRQQAAAQAEYERKKREAEEALRQRLAVQEQARLDAEYDRLHPGSKFDRRPQTDDEGQLEKDLPLIRAQLRQQAELEKARRRNPSLGAGLTAFAHTYNERLEQTRKNPGKNLNLGLQAAQNQERERYAARQQAYADVQYDLQHPGTKYDRAPKLADTYTPTALERFSAEYSVTPEQVSALVIENPQLRESIEKSYQWYDDHQYKWNKTILAESKLSDNDKSGDAVLIRTEADRARKEMSRERSKLLRISYAATDPTHAELYTCSDGSFELQYRAAEELYKKAVDKANKKRNEQVNDGYSYTKWQKEEANKRAGDEIEREATEAFVPFARAKKVRSMVNEDVLYFESFEPEQKYVPQKPTATFTDKGKWNASDYYLNHRTDEDGNEFTTNGSKYAQVVNDWSFVNGDTIQNYTPRGSIDNFFRDVDEFFGQVFTGTTPTAHEYKSFIGSCSSLLFGDGDWSSEADKEKTATMLSLAYYMTDEERARFNTILEKDSGDAADKYFEYLYENVLPARVDQAIAEDTDALLRRETVYDENGNRIGSRGGNALADITMSAWSVPMNLAQGATGAYHQMYTNQNDPVAAQFGSKQYNTAQSLRNSVQENYSGFGKFAYGTVMSMADSATVALIGGGIGKALQGAGLGVKIATKAGSVLGGSLLGGSAFNSAYKEALDRGLSPDKARTVAVGQGFNEMLFESLSLDLLVGHFQKGGILKVSKNGFVNWAVNTLVQGGVEGSEEVFTDIANRLWDNMINGIYSEELSKMREYVADGMSFDKAKRKVNTEYAEQLGMSFLGGAISGGVMGGGATFMGMVQGQDVAKIGRNLDDAAKAEIREYDFKNAEAKEILTGKLTDEDYGRLAMTRLEEMAQTDPVAAEKAAQALIDATVRTDVKVDKRTQTLKTGTENSVSFDYDGVTDVKKMSGVQVEALRFAQTLVKSKVGGVNINVANQLFDKNGNEQNGWYDAKTNTVHVSLNGSQSVVYTISHELTHRLKSGNEEAFASMRDAMKSELESLDLTGSDLPGEYENILGDYLVKDGEQRTAWEALIEYEMDRYAKHGITLDRESAEEEVVCRACETMLERSRLISTMISRNVRGAKTIAKFLSSIYDDIASLKAEAESRGYEDGSPEKLFIDQYTDVEKIANAWANAMKTVSQDTTKKIVKEEGRGGTAFSLKQELRDDGQSLSDKSMKYRKAHKAESQHISDEMLEAANKQIHRMAQRMLPFLTLKNKKGMTYLPDEVLGKTRFGNSSYGGTSIENTTICFRTLAYIDFTNEIKKQIGRPLTVSESFLASQMLYQIAKEPQCLYCYVSLDRKAYDEQLLSYIKQRDKVVEGFNKLPLDERQAITKATRNPSKAFEGDVPLYTEFLAGRKNTEQMRTRFAQWIDIANSGSEAITAADLATDERRGLMRNGDDWQETKRTAGKVSLQDQVIDAERYAQSASWAKKMEEYRAYNGDILKIGKRTVNKLNNEYGLRFYSFSEYSPAFIVENMQQIRDAALKGLMGLAYTKKTDFARIFAGTGMNINVSTFGRWGVDADGNRVVVMDSDQGADWTEVQNLRKQYENVGAVFVATDDAMTEWAIKQDWIDVVIPFHIVRTGANVAEFYKWVVHNSEQNDVTAEGKNATIPAAEHGNSYEKYMSLVNERGLTPRFDKWRPENNPNVTADEYMKLVNETRRTLDATNPLQPIYDTREAARSFAAFVHDGGYYGDYYKAKSEQDIKVPITPEQDILGIGSKTYTEQEGIDRVVADIKAGNKANQVPYGRQDIDEQISRLNKARQLKQHGQKLSIKESDAQYMDLARRYESGDKSVEAELRKQVDAAAKAAGYTIKAWHGSRQAFTVFSKELRGSNTGTKASERWFFAGDKETASSYYPLGVIRELAKTNPNMYGQKDIERMLRNGTTGRLYSLYIKMNNPLEVDVAGYDYESHKEKKDAMVEYLEQADREGRDGIILRHVRDNQLKPQEENSTNYLFRESSQAKSADLITKDDSGNIIPLSERFKTDRTGEEAWKNEDIRYSIRVADSVLGKNFAVPTRKQIESGDATYGGLPVIYKANLHEDASNWTTEIHVGDKFFEHSKETQRHILNHEVAHNLSDELMDQHLEDWNEFAAKFVKEKAVPVGSTAYENGIRTYWEGLYGDIGATSLSETLTHAITEYLDDPARLRSRSAEAYAEIDAFMKRRGDQVITNKSGNPERYSLKDTVRDATLAGQMHEGAKGARALREQAERYNERIEELNGRIGKLNKRIADLKTQMDDASLAERMHRGAEDAAALRKVRDEYNERIAQRDRLLEEVRKQRDAAKQHAVEVRKQERAARVRRDIVAVLKRGNDRIVKLLANPTENSHVPVQFAQAVAEYAQRLNQLLTTSVPMSGENAGIEKQTQKGELNARKILDAYNRSFADEETIALAKEENPNFDPRGLLPTSDYDETLAKMITVMDGIVQGKHINELTADELRFVMNTMRGVMHTVYDANRMIGQSERKAIWKVGSQMVDQLENAPKISKGMRGYLETSLDLRRLALAFSGSNKNAEFVKLVEQLNDGAIEKERIAQVLQGIFAPVTEKYGDEIRKWYGKKAEWIDTGITQNGKKVEITKGMRVSLAMHVLNAGNMNHIANGGITIPNREQYNKGKMTDAYANGETVQLSAEQIEEIISHMTEAEKAYVEAAKEFFHKRTGYYVNKTSLQLLGYRKATVENYFPIHTDKNFTKTDFASLQMDGSIEGQGFLKERVNASNPVYLEDITSVVNRQIRGVALYAGLAVPMRNFNAVMNSTEYFEDENGAWRPRTTVRKAMTQKMGEYGAKVVKGFLEDASEMSHVDVTPMERFAGKLATNYVKAVLLGNLKVAMKQVASYPTAAAVIPWKYLGKALLKGGRNHRLISRADVDLINQYTPLYQMRREGQANEIASIMAKRGMEQKLPWLLGWITKMDVMTVGRLWSAAEYMVADQQNLPVGSDEYYKAVAKVFNDTIQQTQPNFTPLQRNAALRSKNPVVRSLVLFGTQRMQNGGILIEAAMDLKHSKGKSKAEIQAAKRKLGRAVASQIVQNILLIVASIGVDALRGRMKGWQDDDKEITAESLAKGMGDMFLSNFIGSFLGGSETYGLISGLFKQAIGETAYDTEFTVPALDAVETLINFAQNLPDVIKYLTGNHTDNEKLKKAKNFSYDLAKAFGYATGIPLENAIKDLFKGIIPAIKDHVDYFKTGEFPQWWLHQSGKLDNAKTAANYKEWTNLGKKGSVYLAWENRFKDDDSNGIAHRAELLFEDSELSADEKAILLRMANSTKDNPLTSKDGVVYKEDGTVVVDFTNLDRYRASTMLSDKQYEGVLNLVDMGVAEDVAATAFIQYNVQKKQGAKANDRFRDWLFKTIKNPEDRAKVDMAVVGNTVRVEGTIGYKENGEVYADYSSKEMFDLYTSGKKKEKSDAIISTTDTPEAKAKAFADTDNDYHAKGGIVYNDKDKVVADFTSDEAYRASQMGEAKYENYTQAIHYGVDRQTAITAIEKQAELEREGGEGKSKEFRDWLMDNVKTAKDKANIDASIRGDGYTAKDGIVLNEKGKVVSDYTSTSAYKACNLGESHYNKYNDAVKHGMSKENAILAVEKYKEFTGDDDKDNSTQYATWVFNTYKNANDRAIAGAIYTTKPVTIKDGRTYDENGYIYRDYTSAAWYKLSNRTLSKDGKNKRYEAAKQLEKDGYTAEKTVSAYVELDKLKKKSEWKDWLKARGYTDDQIKIFLWSRGWAK